MRAVLYAEDMEPITVLEVSRWALKMLMEQGYVRFLVPPPLPGLHEYADLPENAPVPFKTIETCTIRAEWLVRRGERHMMLFTRDEEGAMLLKAAFLPGQRSTLQEAEKTAFAKGFIEAWMRAGRE